MPRRQHELTDEQWKLIRELLPGKSTDPGRTAADNRLFVDAVLFVDKTGVPWRDLPGRFGNWNSAWRRYDRWCAAGVWPGLADAPGEPDLAEFYLDSMSVKAQHSAARSRRLPGENKRGRTLAAAAAGRAAGGRRSSTPP